MPLSRGEHAEPGEVVAGGALAASPRGRRPDLVSRRQRYNRGVLSLEEISDRLEIQQLLVDYSTAIDTRQFDDLDRVFTEDAYIDYRAMGGIDGRFPDVKAWLAQVLPNFPAYSHLIGNFDVQITGDTATSRMHLLQPDGAGRRRRSRSCSAGSGTTTSSSAPATAGG